MFSIYDLIKLAGGLGLFLYGMKLMSDGIQKRSGPRFRNALNVLTRNRFSGLIAGVTVTSIIQSSSATTVLLVSLVNAGLVSVKQSIGVIMGANIGTTVTAWLVSLIGFKFSISAVALPALAVSIPLMFSKKESRRDIAEMIIGFALLFMGLDIMKNSVPDLQKNIDALGFLKNFSNESHISVLFFIFIGTLITLVIQSSSATMALTITMAFKGWISFPLAAGMVLGENIGTTITALLAASTLNIRAKQSAGAHFLFNVFGVCWMFFVFFPFLHFIELLIPGAAADPANIPIHLSAFHSAFNICNSFILIWFVPQFCNIVQKLFHEDENEKKRIKKRLKMISSTPLATESNLLNVKQEIGRMARVVHDMLVWVMNATREDLKGVKKIEQRVADFENITDKMRFNISNFLTACMAEGLNEDQASRIKGMHRIANELEHTGDACKSIARLFLIKAEKEHDFHKEAEDELFDYISLVLDFLRYNSDFLNNKIQKISFKHALKMEDEINKRRNLLRKIVKKKLMTGKSDVQGELLFMDITRLLEEMGDYCLNISQEIQRSADF
ncbi:MAG: hypothetical protein A2096_12710 [Spirochaetes bacterium GWF1_41_5]|nr:MAG: hypothetical protein A2096_12710 [Spirochaetes bacterium GWF1_41_5]HBE01318.1 Na/Pi cotransporter [Spirochaetia bacterium]